jgi:predicted ATPase
VHYLHRAAEKATQRYAYREAVELLTRALAFLPQLPETPARAQHELAIQMTLGHALIATRGPAAGEVAQTYARARVLCHQVPESLHLAQPLVGLCLFHTMQGDHQTAQELGGHLLRLAHRLDDASALMHAHGALGITALYLGDPVAGRRHLEHGMALYERLTQHPMALLLSLLQVGVVYRIGAAWVLQHLGYPDQARQRSQDALALAQACTSPFNRCNLLLFLAIFHLFRREWGLAQQGVEEALRLATAHSFVLYMAVGQIVRGATLTRQAQGQEGVAHLRQGLAACHTLGTKALHPWGLAMLAESYGRLGQPEAGLTALAEARALIATTREAFYAAEIARLEGELRWQAGSHGPDKGATTALPAAAERCLQHALAVARRQQARWWELRAAMSLARLWQRQGKRAAACELLTPIYGWFTEGFDTADLQEAKALMEELGG